MVTDAREVPTAEIVVLDRARAELAATTSIDVVKDVRDKAEALRQYLKNAERGLDAQNECARVKLWAERRGGELLAGMDLMGRPEKVSHDATLSDLGLTRSTSSRWQRIASIPEPEFVAYLDRADAELTEAHLLKLAKRSTATAGDTPPLPDGVYPTIVIDPPWQYDNKATRGAAEDHYPTMSIEQLKELELPAADDAHLYLWVTNGFIREGFELCDYWGFQYKSLLTWAKPQIGTGNYFRNATEHVIFGMRGKLPTLANDVPTWFLASRAKHSAKPDAFYDLVEKSSPGPWFEMFSRRARLGNWITWGNEAHHERLEA